MKKIYTRKGFTMIELLAVIIILGVVTAISVGAVQTVLKKARDRYYVSQEETINAAARNYMDKNKQYLPKVNGQKTSVKLSELIKTKYISSVVDYNKKQCHIDNSYVQVIKISDQYAYDTYLECDDYKSEIDDLKGEFKNFVITFSGGVNDAKVKITLQESKFGLSSYQYKIIDMDINKVIFTSEEYRLDHSTDLITRSISIADYTPANIKVSVVATNVGGYSHTVSKTHNYKDDGSKVKCGTDTGVETWTNVDRTITVNCIDAADRIGCAKDKFTKKFTGSAKYDVITIMDKNNVRRNCTVPVFIDKGNPSVTTSTVSAATNNLSFTLTDNFSLSGYAVTNSTSTPTSWTSIPGDDVTSFNKTVTVSDGTFYVHVKDSAGNTAYKEQKVITMGIPTVTLKSGGQTISKAADTWKNKDVTMYLSVDSKVDIAKWQYSHDGTNWSDDFTNNSSGWKANYSNGKRNANFTISWDGGWNFYVRAIDNNGVASPKSEAFWIGRDTVKPNVTIKLVSGHRPAPSDDWDLFDGPIILKNVYSDNLSGVEFYDIDFSGDDNVLDNYRDDCGGLADWEEDGKLTFKYSFNDADVNTDPWISQRKKNDILNTAGKFNQDAGYGMAYAYAIDKAGNVNLDNFLFDQDTLGPYAPTIWKQEVVKNATFVSSSCEGDCKERYYHRNQHHLYYTYKCPCNKECAVKLYWYSCKDKAGFSIRIAPPPITTIRGIDEKVTGKCGQTIEQTGEYVCYDHLGREGEHLFLTLKWVN